MAATPRKKRNTQEFIADATSVHGDTYDYSKVEYTATKDKVTIICKEHGEFRQQANFHLRGCGCPQCGKIRTAKSHEDNLDKYLPIFKAFHGDRYDYSKALYAGAGKKIEIVCPSHGSFWQSPMDHRNHGCPKCGAEARAAINTFTQQQFIEKAMAVHGDRYDYSQVEYEKSVAKVKPICPDHGAFLIEANSHLQGKGCTKCGFAATGDKSRYSLSDFLEKAKQVHGSKYDYSLVDYSISTAKVDIICAIHGVFRQTPAQHLSGRDCRKCANEKMAISQRSTTAEFIEKALLIHGGKYEYHAVDYLTAFDAVEITCPTHGNFFQIPNSHLFGNGCRKCSGAGSSKVEKQLQTFVSSLVTAIPNDRKTIAPLEIDCLIPSKNIGIEFCGLYFHSEKIKSKNYHAAKMHRCREKGIELIQVFEDEWYFKNAIVKSVLRGRLGFIENKIFARKTEIVPVSAAEARQFLSDNHLQGYTHAEHRIGLSFNGELVMLATFSNKREAIGGLPANWFELVRLCTKIDTSVVGGFNKLLHHFVAAENPSGLRSYCDLRYFSGAGYVRVGFTKVRETRPNFFYIKGGKRFSRLKFQAHKLASVLPKYDPTLSPADNIAANGYYRIFDCGNAVYELILT